MSEFRQSKKIKVIEPHCRHLNYHHHEKSVVIQLNHCHSQRVMSQEKISKFVNNEEQVIATKEVIDEKPILMKSEVERLCKYLLYDTFNVNQEYEKCLYSLQGTFIDFLKQFIENIQETGVNVVLVRGKHKFDLSNGFIYYGL